MGWERLAAIAAAVLCAATAIYLTGQREQAVRVERANELGTQGHFAAAAQEAARVTGRPASVEGRTVRGRALLALHRYAAADGQFAAGLRDEPKNWALHRDRAIALQALRRSSAADRELSLALALNPRMPLPPGFTVSGLAREPR
jgi:Flp pilus assembly protein TadD